MNLKLTDSERLASELQESTCLYLPSARITGVHRHTYLHFKKMPAFLSQCGVGYLNSGLHTLLAEPSPQLSVLVFLKTVLHDFPQHFLLFLTHISLLSFKKLY